MQARQFQQQADGTFNSSQSNQVDSSVQQAAEQHKSLQKLSEAALPKEAAVSGGPVAAAAPAALGEEDAEDEFDAELATWLGGRLQRMQPHAELTMGSVRVLGRLLDEITVRVLDEARRVNSGEEAAEAAASSAADPTIAGIPAAAANGTPVAPEEEQRQPDQQERRGSQRKSNALTSLDIHKALKRVLPGEPTSNKLRPYLPAVTKQAWHLDKQSLKGIKRQKQAAASAVTDEGTGGSKENAQQPQQHQQVAALP